MSYKDKKWSITVNGRLQRHETTAASTALPPRWSVCTPYWVLSQGCCTSLLRGPDPNLVHSFVAKKSIYQCQHRSLWLNVWSFSNNKRLTDRGSQ